MHKSPCFTAQTLMRSVFTCSTQDEIQFPCHDCQPIVPDMEFMLATPPAAVRQTTCSSWCVVRLSPHKRRSYSHRGEYLYQGFSWMNARTRSISLLPQASSGCFSPLDVLLRAQARERREKRARQDGMGIPRAADCSEMRWITGVPQGIPAFPRSAKTGQVRREFRS
jgi:hypothetical protein